MFYSFEELLLLAAAAIVMDWLIGDPQRLPHPVVVIGKWISRLEKTLAPERAGISPSRSRLLGVVLTMSILAGSWGAMAGIVYAAELIHPWLGYAVSAWFISTTIAVKGLKDAALQVYVPLTEGRLDDMRKYVGYIVSRDTDTLDEREAVRATVETVSENTVDAFVSPVLFALLGGAPLAMLYRAANTLDSMVGYRNDKYRYFGWCSARTDDVLNFVPARLTGALLCLAACFFPQLRAGRGARAIWRFAHRHPSPNSGIPESAVAGALGVELGGLNRYFGVVSERARLGWPIRELTASDIITAIRLLYAVSAILLTGVMGVWWFVR